MYKYYILFFSLYFFSCSTVKFKNDYLRSSENQIKLSFDNSIKSNWQNLDLATDSVPGMSVDRAYDELLNGLKPKKVIVAVIDSGVDIDHEDLDGLIWKNLNEIPNNKIDDDKNGYIDDVFGWNFLGDSYNETLEMSRLVRDNKINHPQYENAKTTVLEKLSEAEENLKLYSPILDNYKIANSIITNYLEKDSYLIDEIKDLESEDEFVIKAKEFILYSDSFDLNLDRLERLVNQYYDFVNYYYNVEFNGRDSVGDDIYDLSDQDYGNPNVMHSRDSESHGTHVSGIIAANRNNNIGMKGINNSLEIMPIRAVPNGDEYDKDISLAIRYAVDNGAQIINMSFGKSFSSNPEWVYEAIKYAEKNNVLIVHAAGNDDKDLDKMDDKNFPNDHKYELEFANNYISVGASTISYNEGLVAYFSNYGQKNVDIYAPGYQIYSLLPGNKYDFKNGTSMAAPAVSGVASLILSYFPKTSAKKLKKIILDSGLEFNFNVEHDGKEISFDNLSRTGKVINAYNALLMASGKKIKK